MATTESSRLEMHLKLKSVLGDKVADTMMDHLPPTGWADVARQSDINHLAALMDTRFAAVDTRINGLESRMDTRFETVTMRINSLENRIDSIAQGIWALAGISLTMWGGMMATIITKF